MLNDKKKAMIRVVSRPFLGKEKFKDFRLCYVDAIPETVFGLTPESKAWQRSAEYRVIKKKLEEEVRQGIRNSIYGMDICQCLKPKCANGIAIHAGVNPYEFFKRVDRINEMYPYEPEEE